MKKVVKLGLVVPMLLLVALATGAAVAEEPQENAELNQDLNRVLNDDASKASRAADATGDDGQTRADSNDADGVGDTVRGSGRDIDVDRSTGDRMSRRGRQGPRGQTDYAGIEAARGSKSKDSKSGKSADEDEDDDEDMSPAYPQPVG